MDMIEWYKKIISYKDKERNKHLDNLHELYEQRMNYRVYKDIFSDDLDFDNKKSLELKISILSRAIKFEEKQLVIISEELEHYEEGLKSYISIM